MLLPVLLVSSCNSGQIGDGDATARSSIKPTVVEISVPGTGSISVDVSSSTVRPVNLLNLVSVSPPSPELQTVLWRASERLVRQCMDTAGFDYAELPAPDFVGQQVSLGNSLDLTESLAEQYGYHLTLIPPRPSVQYALDEYNRVADENQARASSDGTFLTALVGNESGTDRGCQGWAAAELYAPMTSLSDLIPPAFAELRSTVASGVSVDAVVTNALASWQTCMQSAGYAFSGLGDGPAMYLSVSTPSESEIAAAVSDAKCRTESGLVSALKTAESAIVQNWIEDNSQSVERMNEISSELNALAVDILAK